MKFKRRQDVLSKAALFMNSTYRSALLNIRRMTLAVSEDTSGGYKCLPDKQGWLPVRPRSNESSRRQHETKKDLAEFNIAQVCMWGGRPPSVGV